MRTDNEGWNYFTSESTGKIMRICADIADKPIKYQCQFNFNDNLYPDENLWINIGFDIYWLCHVIHYKKDKDKLWHYKDFRFRKKKDNIISIIKKFYDFYKYKRYC